MRPVLLFCCHPLTGHFTPVVRIAAGLRQRGWRVAFLSSAFFRARIEAAGLEFVPLLGAAALDDASLFDRDGLHAEGVASEAVAQLPQSVTDARHQALFALPAAWHSLKAALETLAAHDPDSRFLVVSEAFFYGAMPLKRGAPVPDTVAERLLPHTVCISITAPAIRSRDLPPFGHPAVTPPSDAAQLASIWDAWLAQAAPLTTLLRRKLREAGVPGPGDDVVFMGGANYVCHDAIAQIGVPEFELPRSDVPRGFRVVGVVPPAMPAAPPAFPWWAELVANGPPAGAQKKRRKVVVVAQGTVETEPAELILPCLELLGDDPDVISVAVLGVRGAALARPLPANACVADYLSYDAVLPYADLWVHNGGYGATMHGIAHGVPMVIAGDTQDKPESGKRVQHSGLGVDLGTARPTRSRLQTAIRAVLGDPAYTATAKAMQATAQRMDCVGNIETMVLEQMV